ncbi:hydroxyurea phosphotransferase [Streptomyces tsukubensis]|uniref:Hydroxyurea phosphotransferase n=1 Tax=Streptomyces tsukubensis TaxID=83656 RepID=A0A1V4A7W4_9ACTN|nr:aminoglycoside phosphotransferase family protein [Streptomyces tsukubensis]OON78766.1 hydroxyurea phosphotransferase [Streptomyces tsukubensis]QFR94243.1 hydroxyurea phosphotransferase [Streptomyces tsukubensis]
MIDIPDELVATQIKYGKQAGRAFVAALPGLVEEFLARWDLSPTGPAMHGMAALVVPVERADGTAAALKFQAVDEETKGEAVALRLWGGAGAVRLLDADEESGTMLLERLDSARELSGMADSRAATLVVADLLARLTAGGAPDGMRQLADIGAHMLAALPGALETVGDPWERRLLADCGAALREVLPEPGDRLLHWDLHFGNVLGGVREEWLAIDPKPLAGDPGFDLMPALHNRTDEAEVVWRFDAMTEVLGLDRERARAWTLARALQDFLWNIEDEEPLTVEDVIVARLLLGRN